MTFEKIIDDFSNNGLVIINKFLDQDEIRYLKNFADIKYLENVLYQAKKVHEMRLELLNELGPDNVHPLNQ